MIVSLLDSNIKHTLSLYQNPITQLMKFQQTEVRTVTFQFLTENLQNVPMLRSLMTTDVKNVMIYAIKLPPNQPTLYSMHNNYHACYLAWVERVKYVHLSLSPCLEHT